MKIILAEYIENYKVKIKFNDGTEGIVDFESDLDRYKDTRFYTLTDVENFVKFKINENFDLEWYNGWDYCKDTLYMKIKGINTEDENEVMEFLKKYSLAV